MIEVIPSRSGKPTLRIDERLLHSTYDPVKEAEREVETIAVDRPALVVILGMGLGYAVSAAREKLPEAKILVVESNPEIYSLAMRTAQENGAPLPSDEGVTYVTGRNRNANFAAITHCVGAAETACIRYLSRLVETDPAYYSEIVDTIGRIAAMQVEGLLSTAQFGSLWWENSVRNYREWAALPDVSDWFGSWRGKPVLIFAAGPTLMDDLDLFASYPGALRFVVDTAYRTVQSSGARIDAVFSIDAQEGTLDHFASALPRRLIGAPVVPPRLWPLADERILMSLGGPHFDWFDETLGRKVARLKSGGSVTTFAFDLARRMGADPIVLVGADFAHRAGRRHADGTAYETHEIEALTRFFSRERKSFRGALVKDGYETEQNLAQYAQWMLWEIRDTPSHVFRVSDFGLLKGVPVLSRSDLKKLLDHEPARLAPLTAHPVDPRRILEAFRTERIALQAALSGEMAAFGVLSGFFDPIIRPAAVASTREALQGELLEMVLSQLRKADAVLDEIVCRS